MEQVRLGRTGLYVSKLGFGGIPIQRLCEPEAVEVVRQCQDAGITFFDSATAYTSSEERIGKAVSGHRGGLVLATKSASRRKEGIEAHIQLSLKRLGVEYIDLYQFHNVSDFDTLAKITDPKGPRAVVEADRAACKIKHVGVTSHNMDVAKECVKSGLFETIMFPFNIITAEVEKQLLPLCRQHDVGFIAMKPLAGGLLEDVGLALKYLFQFDDVVTLLGIEKPGEIAQALEVLNGPRQVTDAERQQIQQLRDWLGTKFCHRCDYCQPCPQRIPISTVMHGTSHLKRLPPEQLFEGWLAQAFALALDCSKCGECESKCPYHLPIRDMIEEQANIYHKAKTLHQQSLVVG